MMSNPSVSALRLSPRQAGERGFVLVSCILILVVMALLALSMFRSVGIQHRVAGIVRDKQQALTAAIAAERYAEWWVNSGDPKAYTEASSTACLQVTSVPQACDSSNEIAAPQSLPWSVGGAAVGSTFAPSSLLLATGTPTANALSQAPGYYIVLEKIGPCYSYYKYRITAYGYGGSSNSAAVVQSIYQVGDGSGCYGDE
jgi:type IV pilus assembly protein PilX